jgi:hypothetical protein
MGEKAREIGAVAAADVENPSRRANTRDAGEGFESSALHQARGSGSSKRLLRSSEFRTLGSLHQLGDLLESGGVAEGGLVEDGPDRERLFRIQEPANEATDLVLPLLAQEQAVGVYRAEPRRHQIRRQLQALRERDSGQRRAKLLEETLREPDAQQRQSHVVLDDPAEAPDQADLIELRGHATPLLARIIHEARSENAESTASSRPSDRRPPEAYLAVRRGRPEGEGREDAVLSAFAVERS